MHKQFQKYFSKLKSKLGVKRSIISNLDSLFFIYSSIMPPKSSPAVHHSGKTTTVKYTIHNSSNSNVNRPAQVKRTATSTTVIYRKKSK